jgi:hypothetical protein
MHDLPLKVASLMRDFRPPWFIAGGWAIDLHLGRVTRAHDDIEVGVFRADQLALQRHLEGWELRKATGGELHLWRRGEFLEPPVHEIHCFNTSAELPGLEVLLNEWDGREWVYRRDGRVRRSLDRCVLDAGAGLKYLCPEAVLLYKSKNPREKDERDFAAVAGRLDAERRGWLKGALATCAPHHRWLKSL